MALIISTRREAMIHGAGAAVLLASPLRAAPLEMTGAVETTSGWVRGLRGDGVARFLGVPYGADTGARRFRPPVAPAAWAGVRECLALGAQAVQGPVGTPRPGVSTSGGGDFVARVMQTFKATLETTPGREDCLFLNVWTPDASPARKRPVMVWLHGGGFAMGSGGDIQYEGSNLAARQDVVVVTLNHRLNALGYLYLGDLHSDFVDSGNAGTLDQVLALQWVRDNVERFGGDPGNVTIFGESGGGAKVSALLAVPAAQGLFHKAIIQSGPGVRMVERESAAEVARRTLEVLGLPTSDVHRLAALPAEQVVSAAAQAAAQVRGGAMRTLSPVVDGRTLPAHPFDPAAPAVSRDVPVIVGTNKDEATLFASADPGFMRMTADEARARFVRVLGDERGGAAFDLYRAQRPDDAPTYWLTAMMTDNPTRIDSIRIAERKAAQGGAKAWMYRFDWHMPVLDGVMRSPHGLEVPLVFDNAASMPHFVGTGPEPFAIGGLMARAWAAFARTGDPSLPDFAWPAYDTQSRQTALFDAASRIASDPDGAARRFWTA